MHVNRYPQTVTGWPAQRANWQRGNHLAPTADFRSQITHARERCSMEIVASRAR